METTAVEGRGDAPTQAMPAITVPEEPIDEARRALKWLRNYTRRRRSEQELTAAALSLYASMLSAQAAGVTYYAREPGQPLSTHIYIH